MKLKFTRGVLPQEVDGIISRIMPNTVEGDSFGIAMGNRILLVKVSDLLEFINEQEKTEAQEVKS